MNRTLLALLALLCAAAAVPVASITWQADWDGAFAQAREQQRVVLLAVNMDDEKANDRLAEDVYRDKTVCVLAEEVVSLIASRFDHGSGTCKRFGTVRCEDHQAADKRARGEVLPAGPDGEVVAPQHVLLDGDGKVLLSVAYGITADELAWCIVTARRMLDPETKLPMPEGARAPRRLVTGGVAPADADTVRPLTEGELKEVLKKLGSGTLRGVDRIQEVIKLLATDHPDAVDAVRQQLLDSARAAAGGRRGPEAGERAAEQRRLMVRRIGELSPQSYWEAVAAMLSDNDLELRAEAAVALEQLGATDSVKEIRSRLGKEKDADVLRGLVRALGTCGAEDSGARKKILVHAKEKDDALLRRNALFALGGAGQDKAVAKRLGEALQAGDVEDRRAAALGIGFFRSAELAELLTTARDEAAEGTPLRGTLDAVLEVLDGGDLKLLQAEIGEVCGDTIPRTRWFRGNSE